MSKIKIKAAVISEKIYIRPEHINNISQLESAYTYNLGEEFHCTIEYDDQNKLYSVPSNSYYKLDIDDIEDLRNFEDIQTSLEFAGKLRPEQEEVVDKFFNIGDRVRSGLIHAACSWGKSYASCGLIARANKPTLVLVHTKLLFDQWIDLLKTLIPNTPIGMVGDGKYDVQDITVGLYKTVLNNIDDLHDRFALLIVDEAHFSPADMFSSVVNSLNCRAKIAVTATPQRKDGKHIVFSDYFTPYVVKARESRKLSLPMVKIKQTSTQFIPINPKRDWVREVNKLSKNRQYMSVVKTQAMHYIQEGRCLLILGDRVEWLKQLQERIPKSVLLIGETKNRDEILEGMGTEYNAVLTTKLFDEGVSCHRLDTLFLTFPSNNPIKLEQRIGRIQRDHPDKKYPLIVDFWLHGNIVEKHQENRLRWYKDREFIIV
jgi:superfamily II DNA or RNA helicase